MMSEACPDYQPINCFNFILSCIEECTKDQYQLAYYNAINGRSPSNPNVIMERRLKFLESKLVHHAMDCATGEGVYRIVKRAIAQNKKGLI